MSLLEVKNLSKSFGGVRAVEQLSFSLAAGELLAMIGPNGAGKTTCFNLVNGQLRPDAGEIAFDGKRIERMPARERFRLGLGRSFQVAATFGSMPEMHFSSSVRAPAARSLMESSRLRAISGTRTFSSN